MKKQYEVAEAPKQVYNDVSQEIVPAVSELNEEEWEEEYVDSKASIL